MPPPKGTPNPLEGPGKQALFVWLPFMHELTSMKVTMTLPQWYTQIPILPLTQRTLI